jgi:lipoate-protein ligase B
LPALLTEDLESIKKFLTIVANSEELRNLHKNLDSEALELITKAEATGVIIPEADEKLAALGIRRRR